MDPLTAEQAQHTPEQPPRVALLNDARDDAAHPDLTHATTQTKDRP